MITTTWSWPADPYNGSLPPPLCFTVPAGSPQQSTKVLVTSGGLQVSFRKPRLMMDPSDRSTWQRQYRFTT